MNVSSGDSNRPQATYISRRMVPFVWALLVFVLQVLLPWLVSRIGLRFGWSEGTPAVWNSMGLVAVIAGISLYAWCLRVHFKDYPSTVRLGFSPPHLVVAGPYRVSRNPMYLGALINWLGWTVFYGSPAVFISVILLGSIFAFYVVPREEFQLEATFGVQYVDYKNTVPRWLGGPASSR